jgi:glucosamine-6-phosphate deaminase
MTEEEISTADFAALKSRIIDLKPLTLQTNARLTAGNDFSLMPRQAITMGMAPILKAKKILLLACFPEQEAPLKKLIANPPTPTLPASYIKECADTEIVYTADVITL